MKNAFYSIAYAAILLTGSHAYAQTNSNRSSNFSHNEQRYLDSLKSSIATLFADADVSWDDILTQLQTIGNATTKRFGQNSLSNAFIVHKKGVLCYNKGLDGNPSAFRKAINFYQQAITIRLLFIKKYEHTVTPDIITGYSNIGSCYQKIYDLFSAIDYILKAIRIAETYPLKDSIHTIVLQSKILVSRTYWEISDYDNSLRYYSSVLEDIEKISNRTLQEKLTIWKLRALIEMGGMQADRLNQPGPAITHLTLAEKILLSHQIPKAEVLLANTYHNLGIAYAALEKPDTALLYYKKSIALNKKLATTVALADNYVNLGELYIKMHDTNSAEYYLLKARDLYPKSGSPILSFVYENLGDVEFERGHLEKSIAYDNLAMQYLVPEFKPVTLYSNPDLEHTMIADKEGLLISLHSKAISLSALYKSSKKIECLKSAHATSILADKIVDAMRSEFLEDASKITLVKMAKPVYEQALYTCWELYEHTRNETYLAQAFEWSEKSRAIILLDAARKASINAAIISPLVEREHRLNLKIHYFEKQTLLQASKQDYNLSDSLLTYRRQRAELLTRIKQEFPNYYQLTFGQAMANTNQVQTALKADQAMIEYFVGTNTIFAFVITQNKTEFIKIDLTFPLHALVEDFLKHIYSQDNQFIPPAFSLYKHLILPLTHKASLKPKLIIVPDDVLGSIPFDVLVKKIPTNERIYFPTYNDYLIVDHQISYAFSATTLQEASIKKNIARKSFLGIAPVIDHGIWINGTFFDKLTWNKKEIENAYAICGGKRLYEKDATKEAFLGEASDYGIIHLATHAKANTDIGDLSYIVFGANSSDLLYTKDLYGLNLNADIVILSACQTGAGSLSKGEGIISLARGFTYAGASSVITSLWNVKEEANKDIMFIFYEGIKRGLSKDEALRAAKLRFLKSVTRENQHYAHPFYWAPLLSIGDQKPFVIPNAFPWKWVLIILAICVTLVLLKINFFPRRKE